MKWINLADRQPEWPFKGVVRNIKNGDPYYNLHYNEDGNKYVGTWHVVSLQTYDDLSKFEWLDEDDHSPKYPTLEYVVLTEIHDDLIEKYETLLAKYNKLKSKK